MSTNETKPVSDVTACSVATDESAQKKQEKVLVRKLDCFIAPVMVFTILLAYLDRNNIGFAATQGLSTDLHLVGSQYNVRFSSVPPLVFR
jgi:hypothetical protein